MSRRKRKPRTPSKYEADAMIVEAIVTKIDYQNKIINGKLKTVFYCRSYLCPDGEGRMCIYWDYNKIQVGDTVQMKGRFISSGETENPDLKNVFLVWSLLIKKRENDA